MSAVSGENWTCARATISWLYVLYACQIALVLARRSFWDCSRNPLVTLHESDHSHGAHFDVAHSPLGTLCVSNRSRCGAVPRLIMTAIWRRDLAQTSEKDLVQRSCQETSERPLVESLHRDLWKTGNLTKRPFIESSYRDLAKRCQETSYRGLL